MLENKHNEAAFVHRNVFSFVKVLHIFIGIMENMIAWIMSYACNTVWDGC